MVDAAPFRYRSSRSEAKKNSWNQISDFFHNFPLPESEEVLVKAVQECAEWKRYVELDLEEAEILFENSEIPSLKRRDQRQEQVVSNVEEEPEEDNEDTLTKKQQAELSKVIESYHDKKIWALSGLGQKATQSMKIKSFELPLPQGDGLRQLNTVTNFKLPYSIYCPTVAKERKVKHWNRSLTKNHWLVTNTFEKAKPERHLCHCSIGYCDEHCINRSLQNECMSYNCVYGDKDCGNKQFSLLYKALTEKKPYATGFEVIETPNKGAGLLAIRSYNKGALIIEYTGEVVNLDEVEHRLDTVYKDASNYYFLGLENDLIIDAGQRGSVARFANHSCDPNCEIQKWYVSEEPRIGLFAKRQILAGEEITYDYNFESFENAEPQKCHCGSSNCRGFIGRKAEVPVEEVEPSDSDFDEDQPLYTVNTKFSYVDAEDVEPIGEKIKPKMKNSPVLEKSQTKRTKNGKLNEPVKRNKTKIVVSDDEDDLPLSRPASKSESEPEQESGTPNARLSLSKRLSLSASTSSDEEERSWTRLKDRNMRRRDQTLSRVPNNKRKSVYTGRKFRMNKSVSEKLNKTNKNPFDAPNFSKLKKSKRTIPPFGPQLKQQGCNQDEPVVIDETTVPDTDEQQMVHASNPGSDEYHEYHEYYEQNPQHYDETYQGPYPGYYDEAGNYYEYRPGEQGYEEYQAYVQQLGYDPHAANYDGQDQESYYTQESYRYQPQHPQMQYPPQQGYQSTPPTSHGYYGHNSQPPQPPPQQYPQHRQQYNYDGYPQGQYSPPSQHRQSYPQGEPQWTLPPSSVSPPSATEMATDPRKARKQLTYNR